jgi:hypothetical protein
MKKTLVVVALITLAAVVSSAQTNTNVPKEYFSMHFQHSRGNLTNERMVSYGSFRLWDTGTLWSDDDPSNPGIALCDPGPSCNPDTPGTWNWTILDSWLSDMWSIGVTDVFYTVGGIPRYANNCQGNQPYNCPGNLNQLPDNTYSCGNTTGIGCVLPSDLTSLDGGTIGDGQDGLFQRFITALAEHVYGQTPNTRSACHHAGYLACHAKIVYWDPMNEWDRNQRLYPCTPSCQNNRDMTIYASFGQMQRMTVDLSNIVKSMNCSTNPMVFITCDAKVTTPSTTSPLKQGVIQGFLYCTDQPSNCKNILLGAHPSDNIDAYIAHDYIRNATGAPESVISAFSTMQGYLTDSMDKTKWAQSQWVTEGSWGCDISSGCHGSALTDFDLQAAFVGRLFLEAWSAGWTRWYWYSADNLACAGTPPAITAGTGTLIGVQCGSPFGPGSWWSGKAETQVYNWMVGKTMSQLCAAIPSTTIYTCEFTDSMGKTLAIWDTDSTNYSCSGAQDPTIHHGNCPTHDYPAPTGYTRYETLDPADGTQNMPHQGTIYFAPIGAKPILLLPPPLS